MDAHDEPVADAVPLVGRVGEFAPEPADGGLAPDVDGGLDVSAGVEGANYVKDGGMAAVFVAGAVGLERGRDMGMGVDDGRGGGRRGEEEETLQERAGLVAGHRGEEAGRERARGGDLVRHCDRGPARRRDRGPQRPPLPLYHPGCAGVEGCAIMSRQSSRKDAC
jgi:hypothetical protein